MVFELHGVKYQTSHVDAPLLGCQVQIMGTDDMDDGNNAARAGKEGGRREHAAHPIPCVCRLLMIKTSQDSQREREGGRPWGNFFLGNIGRTDGRGPDEVKECSASLTYANAKIPHTRFS